MKQFLVLAAMLAASSQLLSAAPCSSGSLAGYIGLGSAGCTVGSDTFYNFQTLSGTAGATAIAPTNITIAPTGGSYDPGFSGSTNITAAANTASEAIFTYQISGDSYAGSSITLAGASETADGAVAYTQNYCAGGAFGPDGVSGCTGVPGALVTLDGVSNQDSAAFSSVSFLSITDDFLIDGGLAGSASGGSFTDQFTATPEPAAFLITGLALAIGILVKLRPWEFMHSGDKYE